MFIGITILYVVTTSMVKHLNDKMELYWSIPITMFNIHTCGYFTMQYEQCFYIFGVFQNLKQCWYLVLM
jgi:hypothetical protein